MQAGQVLSVDSKDYLIPPARVAYYVLEIDTCDCLQVPSFFNGVTHQAIVLFNGNFNQIFSGVTHQAIVLFNGNFNQIYSFQNCKK